MIIVVLTLLLLNQQYKILAKLTTISFVVLAAKNSELFLLK